MFKLFFVSLMVFVFSTDLYSKIHFYNMTGSAKKERINHWFSDDEIVVRFRSACATYTDYCALKYVSLSKYELSEVYYANACKFKLDDYKENQETYMYSNGKICEMVTKRNKTLLKIKDVKLCGVYQYDSMDLNLNWTEKQFSDIADYYSTQQWNGDIYFPDRLNRGNMLISVIEVSFTNGSKVRLKISNEPEWANARSGMYVTRYEIGPVVVYNLKQKTVF